MTLIYIILDILTIAALLVLVFAILLAIIRGLKTSAPDHPWYQTRDPDKNLPAISIVVPVYNLEQNIKRLINDLSRLDYPNYEIIVVDDGSTDQTWKLLSQLKNNISNLKIIQHDNNMGRGTAINTGVAKTTAEIIAITDADAAIGQNWLKNGIKPFLHNSDIAAVGGLYRIKDPKHPADKYYDLVREAETYNWEFLNQDKPGPVTRFLSLFLPGFRYYFKTPGSNTFIRKTVLAEVGGFSTVSRAEDVYLSKRLAESQFQAVFDPKLQIQVQGTEYVKNYLRRRARIFTGEVKHGSHGLSGRVLSLFRLLSETFFFLCLLTPIWLVLQNILFLSVVDEVLIYRLFFLFWLK